MIKSTLYYEIPDETTLFEEYPDHVLLTGNQVAGLDAMDPVNDE